eukprot:m51a1_g11121 hypothetical protein (134) ;mRNA; r:116010-116635
MHLQANFLAAFQTAHVSSFPTFVRVELRRDLVALHRLRDTLAATRARSSRTNSRPARWVDSHAPLAAAAAPELSHCLRSPGDATTAIAFHNTVAGDEQDERELYEATSERVPAAHLLLAPLGLAGEATSRSWR